jgi:dolichol kinase
MTKYKEKQVASEIASKVIHMTEQFFFGILNLKGKEAIIPLPHEVPAITLRCSFLTTWRNLTDTYAPKVYNILTQIKNEKTRERISKIISGISDAYTDKKLSNLVKID